MDETDKIYLVVTYIEKYTGRAHCSYEGKQDIATCPMKVSFRASHEDLGGPLWFPSEEAAEKYMKKVAANGTERDFYLIQEFTYHRRTHKDEAKIIFYAKATHGRYWRKATLNAPLVSGRMYGRFLFTTRRQQRIMLTVSMRTLRPLIEAVKNRAYPEAASLPVGLRGF